MPHGPPVRLESGLFERVEEPFAAALPKLIAEVARATTLASVASAIARGLVVELGARTARVYLCSRDGRTLHLVAAENVDVATRARLFTVDLADDLPAAVAARTGLVQLMDAADAPTFGRPHGAGGVARAGSDVAFALPLFAGVRTLGALSAGFGALRPAQVAALGTLSDSLGALLERARLLDEVEHLEHDVHARKERTAMAVHELRQPLNALTLGVAHLARRAEGDDRLALERLRAVGALLDRLVSDLGDASLLDTGRLTLHVAPIDVVGLVESVVARHAPCARLSVSGDVPRVEVDPNRIEQVLTNLLGNASKYGRAGAAPRVDVERRDGAVVVSVTNDGIGIPAEERARVFDAYFRARNRTPGTAGLGLGLYICKKVVEQHGGQIWTDGGASDTRFSFSLPLGSAPSRVSGEHSVVAAPRHR